MDTIVTPPRRAFTHANMGSRPALCTDIDDLAEYMCRSASLHPSFAAPQEALSAQTALAHETEVWCFIHAK
jgi:hypothetical protein